MNVPRLHRRSTILVLIGSLMLVASGTYAMPRGDASPSPSPVPSDSTRASWSLGAVVDVRRPHVEGLTVLAITPGGAAERMGLQPGDRLLTVNGRHLDQGMTPSGTLDEAVQHGDGQLEVRAIRDGRTLAFAGSADRYPVADRHSGAVACGQVTVSGSPPRISEGIYPVRITDIDGTGTPLPMPQHSLPIGKHVLVVAEQIDNRRFDPLQRERRATMRERQGLRAGKVLLIDVEANTRYRIGAQLLPDHLDSTGIRANAYWEPVVWETSTQPCTP